MSADELAELLGDAPPDPFMQLEALLAAPADLRLWGLRKLVETDRAGAMRAVFPDYTAHEQDEFQKAYERERRTRLVRQVLNEGEAADRAGRLPEPISLADMLAQPDEDVAYLVDGLWPVDGKIVLAAKNKSGKTTLVGNLIRSLVDNEPFLDFFAVQPVQRIVLIDDELSEGMIRRWLRDQHIQNAAAVVVVPLRGRTSSFNILDPTTRAEWAKVIGSADVLIFDCLRPALDALGLSEDKDSGRFLEALDELAAEAGCDHLGVVHHMGHGTDERSRGDSRIEDWPDAKWRLVRSDPDNSSSPSFFKAYGRDVDQPETELVFGRNVHWAGDYEPDGDEADRYKRRLSVKPGGGNRAKAKSSAMESDILAYLRDHPGASQRRLLDAVRGDDKAKKHAIAELESAGLILIKEGPRRSLEHFLADAD